MEGWSGIGMSAIVRTPAVPESSGALPPVSPQDKYLNRIIGVIFVSTGDVGRDSIRGNAFTHDSAASSGVVYFKTPVLAGRHSDT